MTVKEGSKVKVEYLGKLDNGEIFDRSDRSGKQEPLEFTIGNKQVIPGFESAVMGMKEGDSTTVELNPEDAYGEVREDLYHEVPKNALPKEQEPKEGMMLMMMSPQGQQIPAVIKEVKDEAIVLDLNHPLAGKKLIFDIKVVGIE